MDGIDRTFGTGRRSLGPTRNRLVPSEGAGGELNPAVAKMARLKIKPIFVRSEPLGQNLDIVTFQANPSFVVKNCDAGRENRQQRPDHDVKRQFIDDHGNCGTH